MIPGWLPQRGAAGQFLPDLQVHQGRRHRRTAGSPVATSKARVANLSWPPVPP